MLILLDTNIWFEYHGLSSPMALALKFFIKNKGHKILLPDIVRMEVEKNLLRKVNSNKQKISEGFDELLKIAGECHEITLLSEDKLKDAIQKVFSDLSDHLIEIKFDMKDVRSSLGKIMEDVAPNKKGNQQFKDGVIWSVAVRQAKKQDVVLISNDAGFFENRDRDKGFLAKNLFNETKSLKHQLVIYKDIPAFLKSQGSIVDGVDKEKLATQILEKLRSNLEELGAEKEHDISPDKITEANIQLFTTETGDLAVDFEIQVSALDLSGKKSVKFFRISGNANFDSVSSTIKGVRTSRKNIYDIVDGEEKKIIGITSMEGECVIGQRIERFRYRHPLESSEN